MASSRNIHPSTSHDQNDDDFYDQPFPQNDQNPQNEQNEVGEQANVGQSSRGGGRGRGRGPQARAPREPKSDIFTIHFKKKEVLDKDKNWDGRTYRAECNYCPTKYKYVKGAGYGNMNIHMTNKHPEKLGVASNQTQLQFNASTEVNQGTSSVLFKYNNVLYRKELAKFVCVKGLPFNFADDDYFQNFIRLSLNPAASKVPRTTLVRDIKKVVGEYQLDLIKHFEKLEHRVSICADGWSDHWQRHSYLGVTCHWIDDSWTIQKRLIAYDCFDPPHSAENIFRKLQLILTKYGLVQKKISISFDNASANTKSIPDLMQLCQPSIGGKYFHIRCLCHIINLCVKEGLEALEAYVKPIRDALYFIAKTNKVTTKWIKFLEQKHLPPKYFSMDVPNRWNSTYKMLNDGFEYKELLMEFFLKMGYDMDLFAHHWNACTNLCKLLKKFYTATESLSGVYYPTSFLVIEHCLAIVQSFCKLRHCPILGSSIVEMRRKWLKYFAQIPSLFLVAKMFDPRIPLEKLEKIIKFYYQNLYPDGDGSHESPTTIVFNTQQELVHLYNEYSVKYNIPIQAPDEDIEEEVQEENDDDDPYGFFNNLANTTVKRPRIASTSSSSSSNSRLPFEMEHYFTTGGDIGKQRPRSVSGEKFDALRWWSSKNDFYPILSLIAKEVLACPASTVAVESAFSVGGNVLDARRSQLTVENLENQLLLGDWVRAEKREQDMPYEEDIQDPQYQYDLDGSTGSSEGEGAN